MQQESVEVTCHTRKTYIKLHRIRAPNSPHAAQSEVSKLHECHVKLMRIKEDKRRSSSHVDRGTSAYSLERVEDCRKKMMETRQKNANAAQSEVSKLRKCHIKLVRIKEDKRRTPTHVDSGTSADSPKRVEECQSKMLETRQKNVNAAQREVSKFRECHDKLVRIKEDKRRSSSHVDRGTSAHSPERVKECRSKMMETRQEVVAKSLATQKSTKLTSKRPIKNLVERTKRMYGGGKRGSFSVFEFPSQTRTSDADDHKDKDPAADIVQRMIEEGNVKVVTRRNGRGITKRKKRVASCLKKKTIKKKTPPSTNGELQPHEKNLQTMANEPFQECVLPVSVAPISAYRPSVNVRKQDESPNKATFSHLARSVLIQQAEKIDLQRNNLTKQLQLLAAAKKFVSTPVNQRVPVQPHTPNLSPIASSHQTVNVSPWRVNDHGHYPSAFNFGTNSSFLPTFSSDNIPASPPKSSQEQNSRHNRPTSPTESHLVETIPSHLNASSAQSLAPISSNNSNAENIPPPGMVSTASDPCTSIFNLRQLPNSRQALGSYRSPLKTINVLEVLILPSWRKNTAKTDQIVDAGDVDARYNENDIAHDDNMFGFDEFLPDESELLNKSSLPQPNQENLREKLHELRKWRPELSNGPDELNLNENSCAGGCGAMKQPSIKEMLCSTMIQPNLQPTADGRRLSNNYSNLFKDPDPDCTFDVNQSRRTYIRPIKRKRKLRHNFVMFPDSEDSSDSEEITQDKKREHKNCNRGIDKELKSYVAEFNEMCKEVDEYQLIVE